MEISKQSFVSIPYLFGRKENFVFIGHLFKGTSNAMSKNRKWNLILINFMLLIVHSDIGNGGKCPLLGFSP